MTKLHADVGSVPGSFDRAGEAICNVARSATEAEALELLSEASVCIGADAAMFCSKVQEATSQIRFMLACDPLWCLEYERREGSKSPPWLQYAEHCSDPICGTELSLQVPEYASAIEAAKAFGFESALIVPSPSARSSVHVSTLMLGSRRPGFFEDAPRKAIRVMARSLSMELHIWRLTQARSELIRRAQLTETDIELLRHERRGFRTKDIARRLSMTAPAIDSRFQRLNARLGVPSRKAAASLAATFGLV